MILVILRPIFNFHNFSCYEIEQLDTFGVLSLKCGQNVVAILEKLQNLEMIRLNNSVLLYTSALCSLLVIICDNPCETCLTFVRIDELGCLGVKVVKKINKSASISACGSFTWTSVLGSHSP